jgi:hypothetical protein
VAVSRGDRVHPLFGTALACGFLAAIAVVLGLFALLFYPFGALMMWVFSDDIRTTAFFFVALGAVAVWGWALDIRDWWRAKRSER